MSAGILILVWGRTIYCQICCTPIQSAALHLDTGTARSARTMAFIPVSRSQLLKHSRPSLLPGSVGNPTGRQALSRATSPVPHEVMAHFLQPGIKCHAGIGTPFKYQRTKKKACKYNFAGLVYKLIVTGFQNGISSSMSLKFDAAGLAAGRADWPAELWRDAGALLP